MPALAQHFLTSRNLGILAIATLLGLAIGRTCGLNATDDASGQLTWLALCYLTSFCPLFVMAFLAMKHGMGLLSFAVVVFIFASIPAYLVSQPDFQPRRHTALAAPATAGAFF
ncbi:MAG: hypothetical protein GC129_02990 [Proteobacteria bacterium]|nr:hypothetical protein [Pseudomonadota bacterium]